MSSKSSWSKDAAREEEREQQREAAWRQQQLKQLEELKALAAAEALVAVLEEKDGKNDGGNTARVDRGATATDTTDTTGTTGTTAADGDSAAREARLRRVIPGGRIEFDPHQPLYTSGTTRVWGGRFNGTRPAVIKCILNATAQTVQANIEQDLLLELSHPNIIRMYVSLGFLCY